MEAARSTAEALASAVCAGDRRALARAISLLENHAPDAADLLRAVYPHTGRATVIGVTGPPGAGKSTLVGALVAHVRPALTVGVVSVDPSSPFTRGAVLGDRIRLAEHFLDEGVFIRSMATRGQLGGLAEAALQAVLLLDAAGFDVVIVETVGTGQSEVAVAGLADLVVLVLMPGAGDAVQALKAGVMEIPDVVAVNKADLPGVDRVVADLDSVLGLAPAGAPRPPLVETSASEGTGIDVLWGALVEHRETLAATGALASRRRRNLRAEVTMLAVAQVDARLRRTIDEDASVRALLDRVADRELDPVTAATMLLERLGPTDDAPDAG